MKHGGILDVLLKAEPTVFAEEWNVDEREKEVEDDAKVLGLNKQDSTSFT